MFGAGLQVYGYPGAKPAQAGPGRAGAPEFAGFLGERRTPRPGPGWAGGGAPRLPHEMEHAPLPPPRPGAAGRRRQPRSKPRLRPGPRSGGGKRGAGGREGGRGRPVKAATRALSGLRPGDPPSPPAAAPAGPPRGPVRGGPGTGFPGAGGLGGRPRGVPVADGRGGGPGAGPTTWRFRGHRPRPPVWPVVGAVPRRSLSVGCTINRNRKPKKGGHAGA